MLEGTDITFAYDRVCDQTRAPATTPIASSVPLASNRATAAEPRVVVAPAPTPHTVLFDTSLFNKKYEQELTISAMMSDLKATRARERQKRLMQSQRETKQQSEPLKPLPLDVTGRGLERRGRFLVQALSAALVIVLALAVHASAAHYIGEFVWSGAPLLWQHCIRLVYPGVVIVLIGTLALFR